MTTRNALLATLLGAALLAAGLATTGAAQAGTVENLERERAIALETLLSADMTVEERQTSIELARTRLVDLERMVLRDESLQGNDTPTVRAAFQNYDLTFLVHASLERDRSLIDHWLEQIGLSTNSLMSARMGRR
jgi:hypothetical protein